METYMTLAGGAVPAGEAMMSFMWLL